ALKALEKNVFTQRGKPLKEAIPFEIPLVIAMEKFVCSDLHPKPARIFIWWVLCMIFASLRFDDAIHVKPHELEVKSEGLFGVSWQTKTERKRRGTKFVVPDVAFSKFPWFKEGLEMFEMEFPLVERDFWIPELDSKSSWRPTPPEYARSLQWLHHLVFVAGKEDEVAQPILSNITDLSWHSARVTMLDQAVHFDRSAQEIGVQANWKNPGPLVLKYTRSRSSLPAKMIKELVQEISREFTPECAQEDDEIDDHEDRDVTLTEFFVKAPEKGSSYDYKFHVCSCDSVEEIACKRAITPEFVHIGSVLPIFGRQKLPEPLCLLMADKGMLLVERMAMLGDSIASVKATLKAIVGDDSKFGPEHISARRAKMEEDPSKIPEIPGEDHAEFREIFVNQHPDVILTYMREPHRKFVERIHRDYLVHGAVAFYEMAEMRTRADRIVQTTGFSKTSDDLLRVVQSDNKVSIASDSDVMDRLHAFFIALEYLNICDFTIEAGPLKYLSELEEWRHDNRGLAVLLAADSLIRKKVYKLNNDKRKDFPSFSLALREENKEKDKPTKPAIKLTEKVERDQRVPEKEWKKIMSFSYTGDFVALPPPPALAANDAPLREPMAAQLSSPPLWERWSEVPRDPDLVKDLGPWCLEIFSGSAGISAAWQDRGLLVLPPIDVMPSALAGGDATLENPRLSLMWQVPQVQQLKLKLHLYNVDLDQCQFGSMFRKPTRFLVSDARLLTLARACDGGHTHVPLKGRVRLPTDEVVFLTKVAQEYPTQLCHQFAEVTHSIVFGIFPQFQPSFELVAPKADRKRQLGDEVVWKGHRQDQAARLACSSGYQLKRGAAKPLLDVECEPGVAIQWALHTAHPFTVRPVLPNDTLSNVKTIVSEPDDLQQRRHARLAFWQHRARELLPDTDRVLRRIPDPALRRLLRGVPDYVDLQLGSCTHVKLYEEFSKAIGSPDPLLLEGLRDGFPIVGEIQRSGRWPPFAKSQQTVPVQEALNRAWEFRSKIFRRCNAVPVSDNLRSLWKATMEDVLEGSTVGPFGSEDEVSEFLGCSDWIPTQRFEVVQKNKVRGCDSATSNLINRTAVITEKLQLVSTDLNVAVLRELRTRGGDRALAGWVLDERKAYRQLPIRPDHRKFSVICLKDPEDGIPKYFVMIGHSFGLVAAVYNYNRRSAFINDLLVKIFEMVAFNFYDDKYGFETAITTPSAKLAAEIVHFILGALFDEKKLQLSVAPVILGVTFNLEELVLEIKEQRKQELRDTIDSVLESGTLDPGLAGKLKGKLMFGASQLWGKVGRAFFRPLSERQYMKDLHGDRMDLNPAIVRSLKYWRRLIQFGPPREISLRSEKPSDVVIFTDGFTPDQRKHEAGPDRIGAVMFDRRAQAPKQLAEVIPRVISEKWIPRKTQIVPIEMIAPILEIETFRDHLRNKDVLLLIDSEAVEAALVKGYSSKEDLCELVEIFWELALEYRINFFIDRVSTDANPADWPSRDQLEIGRSAGWETVLTSWPVVLADF
ncbi:unnamed protein product, partial [Symbiodinium necroappetens]